MSDRAALESLLRASAPNTSHQLRHYLYFPSEGCARKAAASLRKEGFLTEQRLGADGVTWLVLATHRVVPSEELVETVRSTMERIAGSLSGEYDGWEAEVAPPHSSLH